MRGMNMRDMKARQQGKAPKIGRARADKPDPELPPAVDEEEPEPDDGIDASALVDQGDGVRVRRGPRRVADDERGYECPDAPPPGWGDDAA